MKDMQEKIRFFGRIVSVQPRANVWRYRLDNRSHGMKGYNLFLKGVADSEDKDFSIAISEKRRKSFAFTSVMKYLELPGRSCIQSSTMPIITGPGL